MPSAVALVPARSGSQRVPGKNVMPLAGHPLIAYAIAAAREAGVFDAVAVSTDSEEIAAVARRYGAEVPALRPAELATTTSSDHEWIQHVPIVSRTVYQHCSKNAERQIAPQATGLPVVLGRNRPRTLTNSPG